MRCAGVGFSSSYEEFLAHPTSSMSRKARSPACEHVSLDGAPCVRSGSTSRSYCTRKSMGGPSRRQHPHKTPHAQTACERGRPGVCSGVFHDSVALCHADLSGSRSSGSRHAAPWGRFTAMRPCRAEVSLRRPGFCIGSHARDIAFT